MASVVFLPSVAREQLTASPVWSGPVHEEDVIVGRSAGGQLRVEHNGETTLLPPVNGLINGWALDEPGFLGLSKDEPLEDFFVLEDGAQIQLEVLSFDLAFQGWTPGFASIFHLPGDVWTIGGAEFDEHPTWHINSDHPGFDPNQVEWQATFRLLDVGSTAYNPSEPITLTFTNVPEPGGLGLLGLMAGLRRRRVRRAEKGRKET
jgi:hypothetical protein